MSAAAPAVLRAAGPADAPAIVALVSECFEEYRRIAPPGWEGPDQAGALDRMQAALARPGTTGSVARARSRHAGHVLWIPAADSERLESSEPGLAYLWQLFVGAAYRGSGVARALLASAVRGAAGRGYREMRLLTPREQARARRFYEREGWSLLGDWGVDPDLRLPIVEYGRRLCPASGQNEAP